VSGDRLARAYRSASLRRDQMVKAANGCFDGLWLGLLDRDALARLDEAFYTGGRDVLDGRAFSYTEEQHNLSGLQSWEEAAVDAHFPAGGRVVVTGAGGGREVIALLDRGFDAVGYEPNAALVSAGSALLERRGHPGRLRACERDAFPADAEPCDAVVVGWGSYMLIPGRMRRIAFLQAARRVLPDGAPLLCSFFVRPGGGRYFKTVSGTANVVRRLRRGEPAELGDAVGHNFVHVFTREEIASELAAAGFRMLSFAAEPYGHAVAVAGPPAGLNGHAAVRRPAAERPVPAPPLDPVLELTGITKRWPRLEHPVLDGVDLALEPGTTTIIGGRNGTGKTTLLRIAAGLIGPDSGGVRLDGLHPVADRAAFQQSVGFLSAANGGLYARLSVAWHLDWWARLAFIPQERRRSVIAGALRRFDLEALRDRRTDRLSMGQRQRVRLAGAFLHDPDVLLLDEPANSLDGEGIALLARAIDAAVDRGAAALVCMPSGVAEAIVADRHLLLDRGVLRS
jgi:ABC-type multidrug transport system ATPase subunit